MNGGGLLTSTLRRITERIEREMELERTNQQLEKFVSVVSHDLRNPLTEAEGRVAHAKEIGNLDHLEKVVAAHEQMVEMIEQLLRLATWGESLDMTGEIDFAILPINC